MWKTTREHRKTWPRGRTYCDLSGGGSFGACWSVGVISAPDRSSVELRRLASQLGMRFPPVGTKQAKVSLTEPMRTMFKALQAVVDRRIAFRLAIIIAGMLLADGRRTAIAWFVAGGVPRQPHLRQAEAPLGQAGCTSTSWQSNTLVELCSWDQAKSELTDRGDRPWDNAQRRPSHADRRRKIAREMLRNPILAALPATLNKPQFRTLLEHVIALAA